MPITKIPFPFLCMKSWVHFKTNPCHYFFHLHYHWCFCQICYKQTHQDTGRVFFMQKLNIFQLVSVLPGWLVFTSTRGNKLYCTVHIYLFCVAATNCPLNPMVTAAPSKGLIKHTHNSWSHTIFLKTKKKII